MSTVAMGELIPGEYISDGFFKTDDPQLERGSDVWMEANQSSTRLFEKSKIFTLRDERENIQKKTFTKWVNSHLQKIGAHINDLYHDFQDGRKLTLLLEILSAEKLPRPSKGRMRIHMLENVENSLVFLKKKEVPLTNVGNHDIVDGNPKITLGLIWTIILRFQIQDIMIETDSTEKRSAKDALLLWCQSKTQDYPRVNISNFTTSWRDGLAFNAIIHKHRPDLIDLDRLVKEDPITNLNIAFDTAERELGVFRLLDAPDVCLEFPDEKSIMTYVATYYQYFSKMKQVEVSGSRIQKVIKQSLDNEKLIQEYQTLSSSLMKWIQERLEKLSSLSLGNSLPSVQQQMMDFNLYRTQEKPPKFAEKCNLEIQMFEISSQLRLNHQKMYGNIPELLSDINEAWTDLEKQEHKCEVLIRDELIRQQRLEEMANRFDRKANLRKAWLNENCILLTTDNFGQELPTVEASVKKHEAIETDIEAYEVRISGVQSLSENLSQENFHRTESINATAEKVVSLWKKLLKLLECRSSQLKKHLNLHKIFQEMIYLLDWMDELKVCLMSDDYGNHLLEVEDLLQKHSLVEADIAAQAERVKNTNTSADIFLENSLNDQADGYKPDIDTIKRNQGELLNNYQELCELADKRRKMLEESLKLHTFYRDLEEEGIWLSEKEYFVSSTEYGPDLHSTTQMIQQHNTLAQELAARKLQTDDLLKHSGELLENMTYATEKVNEYLKTLTEKWLVVNELAAKRKKHLEEALRLHQFFTDCREVEADMDDLKAPIGSTDYGNSEETVNELLRKHERLTEQLDSIHEAIVAIEEQRLTTLGEQDKEDPVVLEAKKRLDDHYDALKEKMVNRKQKLLDVLAVYQMYNKADLVKTWVEERQSQLTTYLQVERTHDLERCRIIDQRFDGFDKELVTNTERVKIVNELADDIVAKDPASAEEINEKRNKLNSDWDTLCKEAEEKKTELNNCLILQTFFTEITETQSWVMEKAGLLSSVEDPGADLSSVITLQRRLNSIERDIAALPSKLQDLHAQAVDLSVEFPEEAVQIQTKYDNLQSCWSSLTHMIKVKNDSLAETGELKRFIISLDDFLNWLQQISEVCSVEDLPQSLSEAETVLDAHFEVKNVIDQHADEYKSLSNEGPKFVKEDQIDLQTQSLRQQMEEMQDGWEQLEVLWKGRKVILEQCMNYQLFLRDSKQCESILGQQELFLSKQGESPTADAVSDEIKKLEEFVKKCETQDEKINHILHYANQLDENNHYAKEKIKEKANIIEERLKNNRHNADALAAKLDEDLQLKQFLEDSDEVIDWMNERFQLASEESYEDLTNLRSKLMKHAAFEAELEANKTKIEALKKTGGQIIIANSENQDVVESRLEKIGELWDQLNKTSRDKKARLTEANRVQEFNGEVVNLDKWIDEINNTLKDEETGTDITTARALHNKHKRIEKEVEMKKQRMIELSANPGEVDEEKIVAEQLIMEERFQTLEEPLTERRVVLDESLLFYQYKRDVEDAHLWIDEKEPILNSGNVGSTLHDVQRFNKRHSNFCTEVDGHEPLIIALYGRGDELINENHPKAAEVKELNDNLKKRWDGMKELSQSHQEKLNESLQAKKYFFDATEAESWMSEQELVLLGDDRGKDEENVQKMLKKHHTLENTIADYDDTIHQFNEVAQNLINEGHLESELIQTTQNRIDELFARLKELAGERHDKLDEHLKLFQFSREVQDLESWIADRELVALSQDIGGDFDNVQMLEERFESFASETENIGTERVQIVNTIALQLIANRHDDSVLITEWKSNLDVCWENLLELLETRKEMLTAAHEFHRFFHDAKETMVMIADKEKQLTEDLGRDQQSVYTLQRQHKAFEADLQPLGVQVAGLQEFSSLLEVSYAGDKRSDIKTKEKEVIQAWKNFLERVEQRTHQLGESDEYQRLLMSIQSLLLWIHDMQLQIGSDDKPKDISQCEHLMDIHHGRKIEMDAKEDKFKKVFQLAEILISKNHYATAEIGERVVSLRGDKSNLEEEWDLHWEDLQLTLEVMLFARDAHLADEWVTQNYHHISDKPSDQNLETILKHLEKQTNFERLLGKQDERFSALERLTTFELRNARQKQLETAKKEKEEKEKLDRELAEKREREIEVERAREQEEKQAKDSAQQKRSNSQISTLQGEPELTISIEVPQLNASVSEVSTFPINGTHEEILPTEEYSELKIGEDGIKMLGYLSRKPTKESQNRKAHGRVWKQFYVLLKDNDLIFFRTEKEAQMRLKPIQTVSVLSSNVAVASDYHKKKNVLRLYLASGAEYLMQTESADEMSLWIQHVRGSSVRGNENEDELKNRLSSIIIPPAGSHNYEHVSPTQDIAKKEKKRTSSLFSKKKKSSKSDKLDLSSKTDL